MNKPFYCIILFCCFYHISYCSFASETVRVRILEKYHPSKVKVSNSNSPEKSFIINETSQFPVTLNSSDKYLIQVPEQNVERFYRGKLLFGWDKDELLIINELGLEDYVASVVLSEMGWTNVEAMRAQAVLARTWAVKNRRPDMPYDFNDLTNSQVYKGLFPYSESTIRILTDNQGQILTYEGNPIDVLYHAACSDRVFSAYEIWGMKPVPYLKSVKLPDILTASRKDTIWERIISKASIDNLFRDKINSSHPVSYKKTFNNGKLGVYVNDQWVGIDDFRLTINRSLGWNQIRSNDFNMRILGDKIFFQGKGFGHMVGMGQQEAVTLGRNGYDYYKILSFFYPGTEIIKEYDIKDSAP